MHDLVLDFAVAQHADGELSRQHRRVVDAFRDARPKDAFGRRKFEKSVVADSMCTYVCNEIGLHVAAAYQSGHEDCVLSLLSDCPQDAIVVAAGHTIGVERLRSLAEASESSADWWAAARYYSVLQVVTHENDGVAAAVDPSSKALDAMEKLLSVGNPVDGPPRCTFTISNGISSITAKPIASPFSAIPGPDEAVTPNVPPNEAPIAAQIAAISSSA